MYLPLTIVICIYLYVIGSCIGSFINVIAWRTPRGISIARGRSFCPSCRTQLKAYELVPVFSYIFLRGKCRTCGAKIPLRDMLMELLSGLMFAASFISFGFTWATVFSIVFLSILLTMSLIDWDTMEISNITIISLFIMAALSPFLLTNADIKSRIIGFFVLSVPMIIICLIKKGAFGSGDIWIIAPCGFVLGWKLVLLAGFLAIIICGAFVLVLMVKKKLTKESRVPFGPFIALGCAASLLWGEGILGAYLGLFGF